MLGALYGDVIGSFYEEHHNKGSNLSSDGKLMFTDGSVLIAATAQIIIEYATEDISIFTAGRMAKDYAIGYREYYSYFPDVQFKEEFVKWVKADRPYVSKNCGTSTIVCAIPIGYAFNTMEQTLKHVKANCLYTNNSKEAIQGANAVAIAVFMARNGESKKVIRRYIEKKTGYDLSVSLKSVSLQRGLRDRISNNVPAAIISFLESSDYKSAIKCAVSFVGGADMRACIAGGIAEAFYHDIPEDISTFCDERIHSAVKETVREFNSRLQTHK